ANSLINSTVPKILEISQIINASLLAGNFRFKKLSTGRILTIADDIRTDNENGVTKRPGIVDNEGRITSIAVDDKYPFTLYHKVDKLDYKLLEYGPPGSGLEETAQMRMIFLGDQKKLKTRQEEMAAFAVLDIPKELQPAQYQPLTLTSVRIEVDEVDNDRNN